MAVNSLLLAEGAEWDKLQSEAEQRRADFDQLILIPPLLPSRSQACAQTLDALFPAEPGVTRVLLGHGCAQGANSAYAVLQTQLRAAGRDDLSIALLHGDPSLGELLEKWNQSGARRIELNFLMLCAGHHAQEVRAGKPGLGSGLSRAVRDDLRSGTGQLSSFSGIVSFIHGRNGI